MTHRTAAGTRALPQRYYLAADVYQREGERIFGCHWLCAGRISELAADAGPRLVEVEGESLILWRDDDDRLRCYYNVCRHRGTRLCDEQDVRCERGERGERQMLRCPYHGWTYGRDGRLRAAPNMLSVPGFDRGQYPLREAAVAEWQGFVLICLREPPVELPLWWTALGARLAPWQLDQLVPAARIEYRVQANWKLLLQNYSECYHCPIVHPALNALTPYKDSENELDSGPVLGGPMRLAEGVQSMTRTGQACAGPLPGLDPAGRRQVFYYTIFPGLFLSPHPDYVLVHRLQRVAVDCTRVECLWLFHPQAVAAAGFDPLPAVEFWDQTNRQDWQVCEWSQRGIGSRAYEPGPYADLESVLAAFDRHYLETLG